MTYEYGCNIWILSVKVVFDKAQMRGSCQINYNESHKKGFALHLEEPIARYLPFFLFYLFLSLIFTEVKARPILKAFCAHFCLHCLAWEAALTSIF